MDKPVSNQPCLQIYLPEIGSIQITKIAPYQLQVQSQDPQNHPISIDELETAYHHCLRQGLLAPLKSRTMPVTEQERVKELFSA